jgi:hypothetical protein
MQTLLSTLLVLCGLVGFGSPVLISQNSDLIPSGLLLDPYIFVQALEEIAAAGSIYQQNRKLQQDPDFVCDQFNAAGGGVLACECKRYDRRDTIISCDYVNTTCNSDASICYNATVDIIVDLDAKSKSVTQCTYYEKKELNETSTDACITVYPAELGNYTELESCYTSLNSEQCNFCYISDTPNVTLSPIAVTFDCCNVVTDIKGTDNTVGANGGAIPLFDAIAVEDVGKCKGNNNPPAGKTVGQAPGGSIGDAADDGGGGGGGGSGATDGQSGVMTLLVAVMTVATVGAGWL